MALRNLLSTLGGHPYIGRRVLPAFLVARAFHATRGKQEARPQMRTYPGSNAPFTEKMEFVPKQDVLKCYRVMDEHGKVLVEGDVPKISQEQLLDVYRLMVTLNTMDTVLYDAQRQGRLSFYMTNYGEEAAQIGSAMALQPQDVIYGQYREAGVFLYRGYTVDDITAQCVANCNDRGKGRQMPVHYGSKDHNIQTISSPLGTQIPQAAGAGYALKLMKKDAICLAYFGDGAASEGDCQAAFNIAATRKAPTIFFCRNNGWAISTPTKEQYAGDGIAARGPAYGMHTVRVDGNDLFAVYNATTAARDLASRKQVPVLIEAMTYREGHHSTSDDSSRYRSTEEVDYWHQGANPITRVRLYLENKGLWDVDREKMARDESRKKVLKALTDAEREKKPPLRDLFEDVYDTMPWNLQEQKEELDEHLARYADKYPLDQHLA